MKTLCLYHNADHDGKGSAGIVKSVFPDAVFYGLDHTSERPYDFFKSFERVVICDISLKMDIMFELNDICELIWIDHHYSSISEYGEYIKKGYKEIKGSRNVRKAAIEQTYMYFYPDNELPKAIEYLAKFDINPYNCEIAKAFEYGFQSFGHNTPEDEIWQKAINNEIDCERVIETGEALCSWLSIKSEQTLGKLAFESEFNGYKCLCSNKALGYFEFYATVEDKSKYDLFINFYMNKDNKWVLTFYTIKEEVDVSKIAREHFKGGGHKSAAGSGALNNLPEFLSKNSV